MERLDFVSRCGIDCGSISSIKQSHKPLCDASPHIAVEEQFFHQFIDYVTCDKLPEDERHKDFIEKPYVFYRVGPDRVIWDVSRHGGFMNAVARKVLTHGGRAGNKKGANFEGIVAGRLCDETPDVKNLKKNVVFYDETTKLKELEIDIGFVTKMCFISSKQNLTEKASANIKGCKIKV